VQPTSSSTVNIAALNVTLKCECCFLFHFCFPVHSAIYYTVRLKMLSMLLLLSNASSVIALLKCEYVVLLIRVLVFDLFVLPTATKFVVSIIINSSNTTVDLLANSHCLKINVKQYNSMHVHAIY